MNVNRWYQELVADVMIHGEEKTTRNSKVRSNFFTNPYKYSLLEKSFPVVGLKPTAIKKTILEGLYFLSGNCGVEDLPKTLQETWWKPWIDKPRGSFGRFYSYQLRNKGGRFDQIKYLENLLISDRNSRRIAISLWAPEDEEYTVLPCCHSSFIQFWVSKDKFLDMKFYQRSGDVMLGVPHNIVWAATLQILLASSTGLVPRFGQYELGDAHIYRPHWEAAEKIIKYRYDYLPMPTFHLKYAYYGLNIDEMLIRSESNCLNRDDIYDNPLEIHNYEKAELKLGKLELIA